MWLIEFFHSYQPSSTLVTWDSLTIHWYGLALVVAIVAGYFITRQIWRQRSWPTDKTDNLILILLISGLIGARLVDVFFYEWWYFKDHVSEIFYFWQGGLAWHGGLLGAVPALWWWGKLNKLNFWQLADSLAPGLALGQAVGRWGNYFNQELFGLPTNLPWAIPIAATNRPAAYAGFTHFQPVFFYEFLGLVIIGFILWRLLREKFLVNGQLFALYLIITGLFRFGLEFVRVDEQNVFLGWRAGMWIASLTVLFGAVLWFKQRQRADSTRF